MKQQHTALHHQVLSALLLGSALLAGSASAEVLPSFGNVDIKQTSVSGLSSGAFMTSQLYVAHSDIMVGAGVVAGGPYLCAQSNASMPMWETASTTCMNPKTSFSGPNTKKLVEKARQYAADKQIDPLENLKDDRIYLFSGKNDKTVTTQVVDETSNFFTSVGVPKTSIKYDRASLNAGHALITTNQYSECSVNGSPYINDCDYDQASEIIKQIYPGAKAPASTATGKLLAFDQKEFIAPAQFAQSSMSATGHLYVPQACEDGKNTCRVHVVIHGCGQSDETIGDKYYNGTGYNQVADTNNLILLYPQVNKSDANPRGCWDFWGYTDNNYYSRDGIQVKAIHAMIQRLAGAK